MSTAPASPQSAARWAIDALSSRFSVGARHLKAPAPSEAQWLQATALSLRAPDHGGLQPFRFVHIDDAQRPALAEGFAQDAVRRGHSAAEIERARDRALKGPGLVALVGRIRDEVADVTPHEQWICIGAALMNFLNALHLMGFAAKVVSGASVRDPGIAAAFCAPGETLIAWIVAGTASRPPRPKRLDDAAAPFSRWRPDGCAGPASGGRAASAAP